jgi:hypothetical protein
MPISPAAANMSDAGSGVGVNDPTMSPGIVDAIGDGACRPGYFNGLNYAVRVEVAEHTHVAGTPFGEEAGDLSGIVYATGRPGQVYLRLSGDILRRLWDSAG